MSWLVRILIVHTAFCPTEVVNIRNDCDINDKILTTVTT